MVRAGHDPPAIQEQLLNRCISEIGETIPLVMRFLRRQMQQSGASLSVPQLRTLGYVYRHQGSSLSALAEHLGVTAPTASALVERLVQRGLITRVVAQGERRRITLTLTAEGTRLLQRVLDATETKVRERLKELPISDLRRIAEGVQLLGEVLCNDGGEDAR